MPSLNSARLAIAVAFAALATVKIGGAPVPQARPDGEGRSGLAVDFVALLPDGTPVPDLQPSEVEVRINGRVRAVRSLRRVVAAPPRSFMGAAPGLPLPFGTNDDVATGRSIVLVVDQESFVTGREQLLRNAVEGMLARLTPADQTMVVALPFDGVKVPFTSDPVRVRQAMATLAGQGNRNESGSDLAVRTRRFLEALDGLLETEKGRSAPLTVVVFTAGLAAPRRDAPMALGPGMGELLVDHFDRVKVAAGAARANFFLVQPDDVATASTAWRDTISGSTYKGSDNPLEGIEHLAGSTDAVRLPLDASGTGALLRVAKESSAYYVAYIEPDRSEANGRSRQLDVRVTRTGITVRARPEITFPPPEREAAAPRLAMSDILFARTAHTEVRLRVAGFTVREPDGRLRVGVVVEPSDSGTTLASAGAILVDAGGRAIARWFAADAAERPLLGAMAAPQGVYTLRVAVIDSGGRFGAAEDVLDAAITPVGPLSLGSLMLGLSRNDRLIPRLQFGAEPMAIASFDIYGGAAGTPIAATLELARGTEGPVLATLPLALTRANAQRVVATGAVPIGALPPGDYLVRAVVRLEDGTTGRVSRTLRKVGG